MPIYVTAADLVGIYGPDEIAVATDHLNTGSIALNPLAAGLKSASAEIESYARAYGLVPTDVGPNALATAGTFPEWWTEAAKDIAIYRLSLDGGAWTKEKEKRYERWLKRLDAVYPTRAGSDG